MDAKTLHTLEYPRVLEHLAGYCAFAASIEKAHKLLPTTNLDEARQRLAETSEAVQMLVTRPDLTIGGARDVRQSVDLAAHGGVLTPTDLLDVKSTLVAARTLVRTFERLGEQYPTLFEIASQIPAPMGLVDGITRAISERGEIQDSASEALATIRRDLRIAHDRLMTKLQRMVSDPHTSPYLQEALITQRDGRYVLPLRAEFKGRIRAVVHDQSASGATLFVEPLSVVEHNNQFRELQLAERDEERRILTELSQQVAMQAGNILSTVERVADLDLCFAKAKYSDHLAGSEPVLLPMDKSSGRHPGTIIRLYQARHPLLDPTTVVPIDVELDSQTYAMVVTGPNTGGKTVTLKTIGLLALMAQSGLHIPANSGSEISLFHAIYADIGDEQSIEQSLSTFSGHITNIIRILERADHRSLVILDELGAGTDPQEGAALARALLTHLLERGITTLVTTHHPELKAFAHATPGVVNASVEFDLETLRPTFHLTIGLPGRSNALAIAQRLGMPEPIITSARSELNPTDLKAEDLLDEIHRQRDLSRKARSAAEKAHHEVEVMRVELARRLEKIEDERMQVLEKARHQAEEELEEVQDELREVRRQLARTRQPLDVIEEAEGKIEELQDSVVAPVERRSPDESLSRIQRTIRLGDRVRLHSLNTQGVVTSLGEEEAEVSVGVLRIRARLAELQLLGEEKPSTTGFTGLPTARELIATSHPHTTSEPVEGNLRSTTSHIYAESPGIELDLRGQRSDEALDALERYLDSAYLAGLPWVRIIHGKGTGKLRLSVREALSHHPHVKSFESGGDKEGGDGVTVAKLAQ
ncbi:MAG TPA: endonuclease MutS2 [Anaerolineales bacterium]|nr:endonuclease MutS2 [Anaerolineales bacterium]